MGARAAVVGLAVVALSGCATGKAQSRAAVAQPQAIAAAQDLSTYIDAELGFEIARPGGAWQLDSSDEVTPEGLAIPVVLRDKQSGAQVVLQVAPAVATPAQLAERLTMGLREHPGIVTSDPEPLEVAEGAVGFRFAMGDRVLGKVCVREGAPGRVLMVLATWPVAADDAVTEEVDAIIESVRPYGEGAAVAAEKPALRDESLIPKT